MTFALLAKELRQHRWALLTLCILNAIGLALCLVMVLTNPALGTTLRALQGQCWFLAITAIILGNRLVVVEYHAQTQLFLEALPVPRTRVFLVKYFVGLAFSALIAIGSFIVVLLLSIRTEDLTPEFIGLLATRFFLFTWLTYGFFFMAGFLGKFRWAYFAFILLAIIALNMLSEADVFRGGPFKLVRGDFPFERSIWPTDDLILTAVLTTILFIVSWLLASLQEGSVAGKLGERMSYREKITIVVVLIGGLASITLVEAKKKKQPYDTLHAAAASARSITVKVTPPGDAAAALAERLATDLGAMGEFLDLKKLPPLFVTERLDLDADTFETGFLDNAEGVTLRTNFADPDWQYVKFLEYAVGEILGEHSQGRVQHEQSFWILDGFCLFWAHHRAGENAEDDPADLSGARRNLWLRAIYGTRGYAEPITHSEHLRRWFAWQEEVGHHITAGVGWSGLVTLRDEVGEEKFRDFLRATFGSGRPTPKNVLTTVRDIITPPDARLKNSTGIDVTTLLSLWNTQLDRARTELANDLAKIPHLEGRFEFEPQSEDSESFTGEYHFEAPAETANLSRPVLLYGEPFDFHDRVFEIDLLRYPLSLEPGEQKGAVYTDFSVGSRVSYTFSAYHEVLGCRILSGWQLTEVR